MNTQKNGIRESRPPPGPIRIGLFGDEKVGKTSICYSFTNIKFQSDILSTICIDKFEKKQVLENEKEIKSIICDTPGKERFRPVIMKILRYTRGIILVFDVTIIM